MPPRLTRGAALALAALVAAALLAAGAPVVPGGLAASQHTGSLLVAASAAEPPAIGAPPAAPEPGAPTPAPALPTRAPATPTPAPIGAAPATFEPVRWRRSQALGLPWRGRLLAGVQLPAEGVDFLTWDPVLERAPNRGWRRWGTDRLIGVLLRVLRAHRAAFADAPRVPIGDLSRPHGGDFGRHFGALGHASHQNGLDADVYYPPLDRSELAPRRPRQVDRMLAQDLVDRFVRAGATRVFVGLSLRLRGPRRVVRPLAHHDDHLHVRIGAPPRRR